MLGAVAIVLRAPPLRSAVLRFLRLVTVGILALPPLGLAVEPSVVGWTHAAFVVVMAAAIGVTSHRMLRAASGDALTWLVAATVAAYGTHLVGQSLNLQERRAELPFFAVALASHVMTLVGALAGSRALGAVAGIAPSVPRAAAAGVAAVGLVALGGWALPAHYATIGAWLLLHAFALAMLAAATAMARGGGRARVAVAVATAGAVGVAAYLLLGASTQSPTLYAVSTHTFAMRRVLVDSGSAASRTRRLARSLEKRPAWQDGRRAGDRARARNAAPARAPSRAIRSLLLITVDSLRHDATGYATGTADRTPELDALAASSTRFHTAYAQGGWTSLSIGSLLWSRWPSHMRLGRMLVDAQQRSFMEDAVPEGFRATRAFSAPRDEPSRNIFEVAHQAGIPTAAVLNDGFTSFFEPALGFSRGVDRLARPVETIRGESLAQRDVDDALATALAVGELERLSGGRFVLWVHLFGPHLPYAGPDERSRSGYEVDVRHTDEQIGALLATLRRLGRASDTAVIVTADHGEAFEEHGNLAHGGDVFEESVRVPLLVHAPGTAPRDVHEAVGLIDVAPTCLDLLGVPIPAEMQGSSLAATVEDGEPPPDRPVFVETWRSQPDDAAPTAHTVGVIHDRQKVVHDRISGVFSAYDLTRDPTERTNRGGVAFEAAVHADLAATLLGWIRAGEEDR